MKIKRFRCGICNDMIWRTRKGLRDHLRTHIRNQFANSTIKKESQRHTLKPSQRQNWWISEEFK
jgi:hypothetical protein